MIPSANSRNPHRNVVMIPAALGENSNPYLAMICDKLAARGVQVSGFSIFGRNRVADALHIQWLESIYQTRIIWRVPILQSWALARVRSYAKKVRAKGGRVIFTAHNIKPHDAAAVGAYARMRKTIDEIYSLVDEVVCLSESSVAMVKQAYPFNAKTQFTIVRHPHYCDHYGDPLDKSAARAALGIAPSQVVLCSIGHIRQYKCLPELVDMFAEIRKPDEHLIIAGHCDDPTLSARLLATPHPWLTTRLTALTDFEFKQVHAAADFAVFNFRSILNSGSVLGALSLNRPVIAPNLGALSDVAAEVGADWCSLLESPISPTSLRAAIDKFRDAPPTSAPNLAAYAPEAIALDHARIYRSGKARHSKVKTSARWTRPLEGLRNWRKRANGSAMDLATHLAGTSTFVPEPANTNAAQPTAANDSAIDKGTLAGNATEHQRLGDAG